MNNGYVLYLQPNITVPEERLRTLSGCKQLLSSGMNCIVEHLCHSFIVDHSDKTYVVNSVITQQELIEIAETNSKSCPEPAKEFLDYLNTFNRRNTKDLCQSVFSSQPWETEYDKELHCDYDWARNMTYSLSRLYETGSLEHPCIANDQNGV